MNKPGIDADGTAKTEAADHFMKCPGVGSVSICATFEQVAKHIHDGEFEISEGPEPPAREGRVQH